MHEIFAVPAEVVSVPVIRPALGEFRLVILILAVVLLAVSVEGSLRVLPEPEIPVAVPVKVNLMGFKRVPAVCPPM